MKIENGLVFTGKHFTGRIEVLKIEEEKNLLIVALEKKEGTHTSNWNEEWNLVQLWLVLAMESTLLCTNALL